jgi:hypothetical protein
MAVAVCGVIVTVPVSLSVQAARSDMAASNAKPCSRAACTVCFVRRGFVADGADGDCPKPCPSWPFLSMIANSPGPALVSSWANSNGGETQLARTTELKRQTGVGEDVERVQVFQSAPRSCDRGDASGLPAYRRTACFNPRPGRATGATNPCAVS